jgi:hypothetical protein
MRKYWLFFYVTFCCVACCSNTGAVSDKDIYTGFISSVTGEEEIEMVYSTVSPENWEKLRSIIDADGIGENGRRYYEYTSPFRNNPSNSVNHRFDLARLEFNIQKNMKAAYTVKVNLEISDETGNTVMQECVLQTEKKVFVTNLKEEAVLKFSIKRPDGSSQHAEHIIASAIVKPDNESLESFNLIQKYVEQNAGKKTADIESILAFLAEITGGE